MATVQNLIDGAFRLSGVIGSGESPSTAEYGDALIALDEMLDSWTADLGLSLHQDRAVYPIPFGTGGCLIGPGATPSPPNFNGPRPMRLDFAYVLSTDTPTTRVSKLQMLLKEDFAQVSGYPASSTFPLYIAYTPTVSSTGLGSVNWFPVATGAGYFFELFYPVALAQYAAITDVLTVAPGYREAMRYSLAVRLSEEWGRQLSQSVVLRAEELKVNLRTINATANPPSTLVCDPGLTQDYGDSSPLDWRTGDYY